MPLSDLLTTTDELARSGAESVPVPTGQPSLDLDRIDIKGFDHVPLTELWAVLMGQRWSVQLIHAFDRVFEVSEDGPWIDWVPDDLRDRLAELDAVSGPPAASAWAQMPSGLELGDRNSLEQVLAAIATLARRARSLGQGLYLWYSL